MKAATIGEYGAGPVHEFMKAAEGLDGFMTRTKEEMVGIGEDDRRVDLGFQIAGHDPFDGGLSADGHEDGSRNGAVGSVEGASASASVGAFGFEVKVEGLQPLSLTGAGMLRRWEPAASYFLTGSQVML